MTSQPKKVYREKKSELPLKIFPGLRSCAVCGVLIGNINLGGHDGRSAFTGATYCLPCADGVPR